MAKSIAYLLLIGAVALPSIMAERWVQVWSDEFNGNQLDMSKWSYETGPGNNNHELEYNTDRSQNSWVSDGFLHIQALREDYGGRQYTSARMNTNGKYSVLYGKIEMRAKLPFGQGMWPAFWLLGDNLNQVGWPACGEIDIMELIGKDPNNVHSSLHAPSYDTTQNYWHQEGFANDFHTYAANWQPDRIEFYVDGQLFQTYYKTQSGGHWPFDQGQKFFIILNLAVGGDWPGNPDGSTQFPQQYVIDYVRVSEIDWSAEKETQFLQ
ncbi:glycoside hydrolase family 16 [Stylonychia lemnae]|uniref:Glycoside hydrolase family 16 n=1 Tax=Stylonychia lemnae TaxID=5949 RepID=A0A078ASX6_STYLE|nr:glycoside hydrolase family 16 [Stylonychia lemnae]|eukprot:CDW85570.1 glycoside hydrolase family 16 [Stylonychia lemnae]